MVLSWDKDVELGWDENEDEDEDDDKDAVAEFSNILEVEETTTATGQVRGRCEI